MLVLVVGWLLAPWQGAALVRRANSTQQEPASVTPSAPNTPPAQSSANPPARISSTRSGASSAREKAWQILEDACTGDKSGDRATAILVLGLIPNDSKSAKLAEKALTDVRPEVRAAAAAALGNMESRRSMAKLRAAMHARDGAILLSNDKNRIFTVVYLIIDCY